MSERLTIGQVQVRYGRTITLAEATEERAEERAEEPVVEVTETKTYKTIEQAARARAAAWARIDGRA